MCEQMIRIAIPGMGVSRCPGCNALLTFNQDEMAEPDAYDIRCTKSRLFYYAEDQPCGQVLTSDQVPRE